MYLKPKKPQERFNELLAEIDESGISDKHSAARIAIQLVIAEQLHEIHDRLGNMSSSLTNLNEY